MTLPRDFPFAIPTKLPVRIEPCPIVEAIFELRFVTSEPWTTLPGLLFAQIREKYAEQKILPLAQVPEELRRQDPSLVHLPLMRFLGGDFLIQLGPRVVSLATRSKRYPGWPAIVAELKWLNTRIKAAGFAAEGERLGVRYINFFPGNILENLVIELRADNHSLADHECQVIIVLPQPPFTVRLMLANSAMVNAGQEPPTRGTVVDIDTWLGALDFSLSGDILPHFEEGHQIVKHVFFGLLKPEFLSTLNPVY